MTSPALSNSNSPLLPALGRDIRPIFHKKNVFLTKPTLEKRFLGGSLAFCSAVGFCISVYLVWVALSLGKVAGCGTGSAFDCSSILHSRWSTIFGIPISLPAALLYATSFVFVSIPSTFQPLSKWKWSIVSFLAFCAGFAGLWFAGLQFFWLQHLCPYCLGVHSCGLLMMTMIIWKSPAGKLETCRLAAGAVLSLAVLIVGQFSVDPLDSYELIEHNATGIEAVSPSKLVPSSLVPVDDNIFESPGQVSSPDQALLSLRLSMEMFALVSPTVWMSCQTISSVASTPPLDPAIASSPRRTATILKDIKLDVAQWPLLGKPGAKYVLVEMMDYTCQHCQITDKAIRHAMLKYGDDLAVIVLPVPMNATCNPVVKTTAAQHLESCEIAKLAIAVWLVQPEQFTEFHHWLFESNRTYTSAVQHARQIVDQNRLKSEQESTLPAQYIEKTVTLYRRAGGGVIPKLLFPNKTAVGEMRSGVDLITLIEKELRSK